MISKKMEDRINLQIEREIYSAYLYMAMSAKAADWGYDGVARWMMIQYHEEMYHAMKLYVYLQNQDVMPVIPKIDQPQLKVNSVKEMFEATLEHEKFVTGSIRELLELALTEKDYATENLVRWYVTEQVEEEKNGTDILQKLELIGDSKRGLYMLDKELAGRTVDIPLDFTDAEALEG